MHAKINISTESNVFPLKVKNKLKKLRIIKCSPILIK